MRERRRWRWWYTAIIVGASAVVVGAAGVFLAPRIIPNLTATVADGDVAQTLVGGRASATVTVPDGWAYQRPWGSESELVLKAPDGKLSATLTVSPSAPADAVAEEGDVDEPAAVERLASGLDLAHAETDGVLVAAVGASTGALSIRVVAEAPADGMTAYRPALAALLESVRVTS